MDYLLPSVFILAILHFIRYRTNIRVYNILIIGILLYLAFQYIDSVPMIITFVGWIMYLLYDTFFNNNA